MNNTGKNTHPCMIRQLFYVLASFLQLSFGVRSVTYGPIEHTGKKTHPHMIKELLTISDIFYILDEIVSKVWMSSSIIQFIGLTKLNI
ncbi:hypothetical protein YC2023_073938 [Brassica napus]